MSKISIYVKINKVRINNKIVNKFLVLIKKIIPKKLFRKIQPVYHLILNWLAAVIYLFPSNKLIVVGVTGTTGKTTTVFMITELLKNAGLKVGYTSTAMFSDGEKEWLNDKKMTMLGRFFTQRMLRQMVKNKCEVAIVETTSEGIVQNRHRFINYDIVEFTGLYPEHIDSHGSFENYKQAKLKLFKHIGKCKNKNKLISACNNGNFNKTIIVNLDDDYAKEFLQYKADQKIGFTTNNQEENIKDNLKKIIYKYQEMNKTGTKFIFDNIEIQLKVLGKFNALNATAAGCVGKALGIDNVIIKKGLENIESLPGRLERIKKGQNFTIIVDYAFEPVAVTKLYQTISVLKPNKIIHVLGSTGGGRDLARRGKLGKLAGQKADYVIVTNEDPYDDDPMEIIRDVATGAKSLEKSKMKTFFLLKIDLKV